MPRILLLLMALAAPALAAEPAPKKARVAVFDLHATNVETALVENLSELLTEQVSQQANATVISRADVVAILGFERQRQALACDEDVSCAAELAGALGVDRLISGALGKVGGTYLLSLRIVDVRAARVTARTSDTASNVEDLLSVVRRATPLLLAQDELVKPVSQGIGRGPVLMAVGGGLLAAGAVVGVLQRGNVSELEATFAKEGVYDEDRANVARGQAVAANGLMIVGAALAVTGLGVWLW